MRRNVTKQFAADRKVQAATQSLKSGRLNREQRRLSKKGGKK